MFCLMFHREECQDNFEAKQEQLAFTEKQLNNLTCDMKDKIRQMTEEVDRKVRAAGFGLNIFRSNLGQTFKLYWILKQSSELFWI